MISIPRSLAILCVSINLLNVIDAFVTRNARPSSLVGCSNHRKSLCPSLVSPPQERLRRRVNAVNDEDGIGREIQARERPIYNILGLATAVAWTATSVVVLSYHPDPKFVHCSMKHNLFTMGQALAFPLPVLIGTTKTLSQQKDPTLSVGLIVSMTWLASSTLRPAPFCFGYELIRPPVLQILSTLAHVALGGFALLDVMLVDRTLKSTTYPCGFQGFPKRVMKSFIHFWREFVPKKGDASVSSLLYCLSSLGMVWFTVLPIISSYPMATTPSILGKRLSRPAAAWTCLAAFAANTIVRMMNNDSKAAVARRHPLRTGLLVGSALHLILLALKVIGFDDGGLLLPGTGLWDWYPAMMNVPFAAISSCFIHALLVLASLPMS